MTKGLIIDGWNLFSYEGIPNDMKDKKTVAVKQLGDNCAEVLIDLKTMSFELVKSEFNGYNDNRCVIKCDRFSTCLKLADEWFMVFLPLWVGLPIALIIFLDLLYI